MSILLPRPIDLELRIRAAGPGDYSVDLYLDDPESVAGIALAEGARVAFDAEALRSLSLNHLAYASHLSKQLFVDHQLREGWASASGYAGRSGGQTRLRIALDPSSPDLYAIRWELLQHPQSGQFLARDERIRFSRFLSSPDTVRVQRRPREKLSCLAFIAAPEDLGLYNLAPIDREAEAHRADVALGVLRRHVLVSAPEGQRATFDTLADRVRSGYDLVYLLAHGGMSEGRPYLFLEAADGSATSVPGEDIVDALSQISRRPTLVVLASCQSAGGENDDVLHALGPLLVEAGIPAVLAMQGLISMDTVAAFMPTFFRELQQDGQIDLAVTIARRSVQHRSDWWRPVLYSRLRDGQLWTGAETAPHDGAHRESGPLFTKSYKHLLDDYIDPFEVYQRVNLANFVGRDWLTSQVDAFLDECEQGYFIIEAAAGLGKTAFMAHLARERGYIHLFAEQARGEGNIVKALRSLAAQIIVTWELDPYSADNALPSSAVSSDFLFKLLKRAAERRDQSAPDTPLVLVVDGLDEAGTPPGENVLALPRILPKGVYIIVSHRPVEVVLRAEIRRFPATPITADGPLNMSDMRLYLERAAVRPGVAQALCQSGYAVQEFVTSLARKCRGVWIYLRYVIDEIERGERSPLNIETLPNGLWDYYAQFFGRERRTYAEVWKSVLLPILGTLGAIQENVTAVTLFHLAAVPPSHPALDTLLKRWRPFLAVERPDEFRHHRYRLYHASLRDFLTQTVVGSEGDVELSRELSAATLQAHQRIVCRYLTEWGTLKACLPGLMDPQKRDLDDGYGLRNLVTHMEEAALVEDIHRLFKLELVERMAAEPQDPQAQKRASRARKPQPQDTPNHRLVWYLAHAQVGDEARFLSDVERAWRLSDGQRGGSTDVIPYSGLGLQCYYALLNASINSLASNIPISLLKVLVEQHVWPIQKAFSYAQRLPDPHVRAEALAALAPLLAHDLLAEALEVARTIDARQDRALALAGLLPRLSLSPRLQEKALQDCLAAVWQIERVEDQAAALAPIVEYLPEEARVAAVARGLETVRMIEYRPDQIAALAKLMHQVPPVLIPQVTAILQSWPSSAERTAMLEVLAPCLPEPLLHEALRWAEGLDWAGDQARVLSALAPRLTEGLAPTVLEAVRALRWPAYQAQALAALAPYLPAQLLHSAHELAQAIVSAEYRMQARAALAPRLAEAGFYQEALGAARGERPAHRLVYLVARLLLRGPQSLRVSVRTTLRNLRAATKAQDGAEVLQVVAPYLTADTFPDALAVAQDIKDPMAQMQLLGMLAIQIGRLGVFEQAFALVRSIRPTIVRAIVLEMLGPHIPAALASTLFELAQTVERPRDRIRSMVEAARYLPPPERDLALRAILEALSVTPWAELDSDPDPTLEPYPSHRRRRRPGGTSEGDLGALLWDTFRPLDQEEHQQFGDGVAWYLAGERLDVATSRLAVSDYETSLRVSTSRSLVSLVQRLHKGARSSLMDPAVRAQGAIAILARLAPLLPKELLLEALALAQKPADRAGRALVLAVLGLYLPPPLFPQLLARAAEIRREHDRSLALALLAYVLPEEALGSVLELALEIGQEQERANVLMSLASGAPEEMVGTLLALARSFEDPSIQAQMLATLVSRLDEQELYDVLQLAQAIDDPESQADILLAMASDPPPALVEALLDATAFLTSPYNRARVLLKLLPCVDGPIALRAFKMGATLYEPTSEARALLTLTPHLREPHRSQAIERALELGKTVSINRELGQFARYVLRDGEPEIALRIARATSNRYLMGQIAVECPSLRWRARRAMAWLDLGDMLRAHWRRILIVVLIVLALALGLPRVGGQISELLTNGARTAGTATRFVLGELRKLTAEVVIVALAAAGAAVGLIALIKFRESLWRWLTWCFAGLQVALAYRTLTLNKLERAQLIDAYTVQDAEGRYTALAQVALTLPKVAQDIALARALDALRGVDNLASRAEAMVGEYHMSVSTPSTFDSPTGGDRAGYSRQRQTPKVVHKSLFADLPAPFQTRALRELLEPLRSAAWEGRHPAHPGQLTGPIRTLRRWFAWRATMAGWAINREDCRAQALVAIAGHPSPEIAAAVHDAVATAWILDDPAVRTTTLADVAAHASRKDREYVLREAVTAFSEIRDGPQQTTIIRRLAPQLRAYHKLREQMVSHAGAFFEPEDLPISARSEVPEFARQTSASLALQARTLAEIARHLPGPQQRATFEEAFARAQKIEKEQLRTQVLSDLAPLLPREMLADVLRAVEKIGDALTADRALGLLVLNLALEKLLDDAITVAHAIRDPDEQARSLVMAAQHLSEPRSTELSRRALAATRDVQQHAPRTILQQWLVERFVEMGKPLLVLQTLWVMHDLRRRLATVIWLATRPVAPLFQSLWALLKGVNWPRVAGLVLTFPLIVVPPLVWARGLHWYLSRARRSKVSTLLVALLAWSLPSMAWFRKGKTAMLTALELEEDGPGTRGVLAYLAPALTSEETVRELVTHLEKQTRLIEQGETLLALIPRLPDNMLPRVLDLTPAIRTKQAEVLLELIQRLSEGSMPRVLGVARAMRNSKDQAEVLLALIPRLSEELLQKALSAVSVVDESKEQAKVLLALIPRLPEVATPRAMTVVRTMGEEQDRANLIRALGVKQAPQVIRGLLELVNELEDQRLQALTLARLAAHLPEQRVLEVYQRIQLVEDTEERVTALLDLAPALPGPRQPEALALVSYVIREAKAGRGGVLSEEGFLALKSGLLAMKHFWVALEATLALPVGERQVMALMALVGELPEPYRLEARRSALLAACAINTLELRARLLPAVFLQLEHISPSALTAVWQTAGQQAGVLHVLASRTREHLLQDLLPLHLLIARLAGPKALADVADAINRALRCFP